MLHHFQCFKTPPSNRVLLACSIIFTISTQISCGAFNTKSAFSKELKETQKITTSETVVYMPPPKLQKNAAAEHSKKFALMALFSNLSYSKHLNKNKRSDPDCNISIAQHPISFIDPIKTTIVEGVSTHIPSWRRWNDPLGCISKHGLYYEVYVYGKPNEIEEAVVAIRGTENNIEDWWTNFRIGTLGFESKAYELARLKIHESIKKLRTLSRKKEDLKVYLTGHSLGGGLAQQSAYTETNVEAIVFNTSPVTNWSHIRLNNLIAEGNGDPKITRVTEGGEALSYLRWLTSRVNSKRFNRSDYEFYFTKEKRLTEPRIRSAIDAHSMNILTCNFALRINHEAADLHFSSEMANNVLNSYPVEPGGEVVCPKEYFDETWKSNYKPKLPTPPQSL